MKGLSNCQRSPASCQGGDPDRDRAQELSRRWEEYNGVEELVGKGQASACEVRHALCVLPKLQRCGVARSLRDEDKGEGLGLRDK